MLSTDLLRNVMRDPSDTMRRRSLALRLTASPFSMGTTALRMAERHVDDEFARVLERGRSPRDGHPRARRARTRRIEDHARTGCASTGGCSSSPSTPTRSPASCVAWTAEGLTAAPSTDRCRRPSEQPRSQRSKSGEAPIMVSTDAGAEGQNLQFCNCVLNYDLPWNPMRIEQRIGRVDRLTQPRDEVFIANLYARGTVDESGVSAARREAADVRAAVRAGDHDPRRAR